MSRLIQSCFSHLTYSLEQSGNRVVSDWEGSTETATDHFIGPFVTRAKVKLLVRRLVDGRWTNVCALTQFYRKRHPDCSLMLMDWTVKRVAMSSVPLRHHRGKFLPFGGEGFLTAAYISIHQQAERSLVHHIRCCRKTYGLGRTL